ncbi:MAG: Z1 domain-containing protein [Gammaproteobacteria bacterium]|nr:Z1 domain-containing protein [Gammaproteobacteria bacterium]
MPGPQVDKLVKDILRALPRVKDLDAAVDDVRQGLEDLMPGLLASLSSEILEAREVVERQFKNIEILREISVFRSRPRWYFGPKPSDLHWPAVRDFLLNTKGWPKGNVDGIDRASNEVVSLLADPGKADFDCRGLVVGHVQSGKTANMTAVAAKALDAGYDTVVVLAGMTNKLRYQTQLRLFDDLVMRNPENWQVLTPNEPDSDFPLPAQGGFLRHLDKAQLAVVKKNVSPLENLKVAVGRTLPGVLKRLRILVIDDECDQASINSASGELDMTAINHRIRELLHLLPAASYVGYTATPFANVLINPYAVEGQKLDDLYPRDFITALPCPDSYFGAERLFGRAPSDPDDIQPEEEGLDMIRNVPDEEEALLLPQSRNDWDHFQPQMTDSLQSAVLYFLACCAARHERGDGTSHMTMLVHTSAYRVAHWRTADLIRRWVEANRTKILDPASPLGHRIQEMWTEELACIPEGITEAATVPAERVLEHLGTVLDRLEYPVENGDSDDRVDYTTGGAKTYIVVGGTILARGLTLEGLTVSYFLRSANQYDTLLQMGRWFGFRPGYEDLPRIWMPQDLNLRFRALAGVEQEIRDDIDQYGRQHKTPMDIAVRIRAIPGMAITGANRMRAARRCAVSYWGTHRQTTRFSHRDGRLLRGNWAAAAKLVDLADALDLKDVEAEGRGVKLWRKVPRSLIRRFLEDYSVHPTHSDLDSRMLVPFIDQDDHRLSEWNVGIVEAGRGPESPETLGGTATVRMVTRARLVDGDSDADIKALMSKRDVLFDCAGDPPTNGSGWAALKGQRLESVGEVPLLLLYPVDRTSGPKRKSSVRTALDAAFDVLGYGIVFPGSVTEGGDYVSVELQAPSAEEIEDMDAEHADQEVAAGVA